MSLPKNLKKLKERCHRSLPLLNIKARPVDISWGVAPPKPESPRWAYYFDTSEYCRFWLSNPALSNLLHCGFGEIIGNPTELWHGDAWMESVRSTSGNFARIVELARDPRASSVVLLPSDCVSFINSSGELALGRIKAIGLDKRSRQSNETGVVSAIMNGLVPRTQLPGNIENIIIQQSHMVSPVTDIPDVYASYPSSLPELILCESRDIIPNSAIRERIWVYFTDYESPESLLLSLLPHAPTFCVRRIVYMTGGRVWVRPVSRRDRVIAETELVTFTPDTVLVSFVNNGNEGSS